MIWKEANYEAIIAVGKVGGLWILWDPMKVEAKRIHYPSNRCLSMKIKCKSSNYNFIMSNIYAPNLLTRRRFFWDLISNHRNMFPTIPWLIGGYFNSPLNLKDKYG